MPIYKDYDYRKDIPNTVVITEERLFELEMAKRERDELRKFIDAEHTDERTCGLDCARCWKNKFVNKEN